MPEVWRSVIDGVSDIRSRFLDLTFGDKDNSPVEIQKRLQREAFSDIMKLRERQDKLEQLLTACRFGKAAPFAGASTRVKGFVNGAGALFFRKEEVQRNGNPVIMDGANISTGLDSRFMFETKLRQNDTLVVELAADGKYIFQEDLGSPLVLSKVVYSTSLNDHLSLVTIPVGGKCEDFSADPYLQTGQYATRFSSSMRPPLLAEHHKYAAGLVLTSKDIAGSVSTLVYDQWRQTTAGNTCNSLSTYGQISYRVAEQSKLTLSAAWQGAYVFPRHIKVGNRLCSLGSSQTQVLASSKGRAGKKAPRQCVSLELDIDEDTKIGGWIEVERSNPRVHSWAVSLLDCPNGETGWGACLKRRIEGQSSQYQAESFLVVGLGTNATVQPGIALMVDGKDCTPALVLRSSWSF